MLESEEYKKFEKDLKALKNTVLINSPKELTEDIVKIRYFFQQEAAVRAGLEQLENRLQSTLRLKGINYYEFIDNDEPKGFKVLFRYLKKLGGNHFF